VATGGTAEDKHIPLSEEETSFEWRVRDKERGPLLPGQDVDEEKTKTVALRLRQVMRDSTQGKC
jgi:hypothetical protein